MNGIVLALLTTFMAAPGLALAESGEAADGPVLYLVGAEPTTRAEDIRREMDDAGLVPVEHLPQIHLHVGRPKDVGRFQQEGIERLRASDSVRYVEQNFRVQANSLPATAAVPGDPQWSEQNGMRRLGVETAWDRQTGNASIIVAISDSGVDMLHPDLRARMWTNTGEVAGNGVDDDGNGYVDDVGGWDWVANDNDPMDENRHGTHVAGIVGAEANNGTGISGVNWEVTLMPLRFLDAEGSGSTLGGIKTILYAADMGARLINASWGGGGFSQGLLDAIHYSFSKGALLIAAAGNDGRSVDVGPHYPSGYDAPGVIAVGSSEADGRLSGFSNFGQLTVDVVAPGSSILSTLPNGNWGRLSGTSMATPMVSGAGALLLAERPSLNALELRNALLNAVVPRKAYEGKVSTRGDLRADLALSQLDGGFQVWPATITLAKGATFRFTAFGASEPITWSVNDPAVATVTESDGLLTAKELGEVVVTASTPDGKSASTRLVTIAPPTSGGGGGGCVSAPTARPRTAADTGGMALSMGLPFMVGWLARRRWRGRQSATARV